MKLFTEVKLFYKLFLGIFCVALIPMGLGVFIFSRGLAVYQQATTVEMSRGRINKVVSQLSNTMDAIENSLRFTAHNIQLSDSDNLFLQNCAQLHPEILNLLVVDQEWRVHASYSRFGFVAKDSEVNPLEFFINRERHFIFRNWNLEPLLSVVYPLFSLRTGEQSGLLQAEISLKNFFVGLIDNQHQTGHLYVVSSEGLIISHPNLNYVLEGRDVSSLPVVQGLMAGQKFSHVEYIGLKDEAVVGVGMKVNDMPLYVIEETPVEVAYALSRKLVRDMLLTLAWAMFFVLLAAMWGSRSITRPIELLAKATARIGKGDLDFKVAKSSRWFRDEVDLFSVRFNRMIIALKDDRKWRREMEQRLAEERERLAVTLASIGDGVISTNLDGEIMLMNRAAEELTGWALADAAGQPLAEFLRFIDEETGKFYTDPLKKIFAQNPHAELIENVLFVARDGRELLLAVSGAPVRDSKSRIIGTVCIFRDVTEKSKMQTELQRAEKIQSVGILAGGIAHDFNNLLTGILGNISLAQLEVEPGGQLASLLKNAEKSALRSRDLTQQLLTFSKGGMPVKEVTSVAEMIADSCSFLFRGSKVRCLADVPADLWPVEIDAGQISQVLNNLLINGRQAMPKGGAIRVWGENVVLDQDSRIPLPPGRYLQISVQDEGIGITQKEMERIFDPYYTTKEEGNGLGLSSCYSIISKHEGYISVDSKPGKGSIFTILLPASDKKHVAGEHGREKREIHPGDGRILIMDDDEMVREVAGRIFSHLGYESSCAGDGVEAVRLYQDAMAAGTPFDAVIMDLTIPGGMGGKEAVVEILRLDPKARVIVASGYSNDPIMADFRSYGFVGMVVKPFNVEALSTVLGRVLEKG